MNRSSYCLWLGTACIHEGYKCSECPLTDLWCDEMETVIDAVYKNGYKNAVDTYTNEIRDLNTLPHLARYMNGEIDLETLLILSSEDVAIKLKEKI